MILMLLQAGKPVDLRNVIHDYFNRTTADPGTWQEIILGVAAVLIFLVVLHIVFYAEKRGGSPRQVHHPEKLYQEVLHRLPLSRSQRSVLTDMAKQLHLPSPTRILLSPSLFSEASRQWQSLGPPPHSALDLAAIAAILFPESAEPSE